jgi:hypothetical protein
MPKAYEVCRAAIAKLLGFMARLSAYESEFAFGVVPAHLRATVMHDLQSKTVIADHIFEYARFS